MIKFAWITMALACMVSFTYTRVQAHAEAQEFQLATAQLVAPQVLANVKDDLAHGDRHGAKVELAWFAQAHTGLGQALAPYTLTDR